MPWLLSYSIFPHIAVSVKADLIDPETTPRVGLVEAIDLTLISYTPVCVHGGEAQQCHMILSYFRETNLLAIDVRKRNVEVADAANLRLWQGVYPSDLLCGLLLLTYDSYRAKCKVVEMVSPLTLGIESVVDISHSGKDA